MVKRSFLRFLLLIALCAALMVSAGACQSVQPTAAPTTAAATAAPEATPEPPAAPAEIVKLSLFSMYANNTHDQAEWLMKYLRENLSLELESMPVTGTDGVQMIQALMASGELPDIVGFGDKTFGINSAKAGLLLCLDDNQDKLPNLFGSNDQFKFAIQYSRDNMSDDSHKLYLMSTQIGALDGINYDPQLRWDIYRDIGMPKISTLEDYLPVIKQMLEKYPQNEDNEKTYGISIFASWDYRSMASATYLSVLYGVDCEYSSTLFETPVDGNGVPIALLDDASQYKRALKFFFQANQMGILDPDSATQTWDIVSEKYSKGRVMFSPWAWAVGSYNVKTNTDVDDFKGYATVWADDFKNPIFPDQYTGSNWSLAIGSSTKHPDAALRFYDFFYSFDGNCVLYNGPKGILWDMNADGIRYTPDSGWDIIEKLNGEMPDGGTQSAGAGVINSRSISNFAIDPNTKGQTLDRWYWDDAMNRNKTKLELDWREAMDSKNWIGEIGASDAVKMGRAKNQVLKSTQAVNMVAVPSDEMITIMDQIGEVIKTSSWQMIFAKDDAEFEKIWDQAQTDAEGLGLPQVSEWYIKAWADALDMSGKYKP